MEIRVNLRQFTNYFELRQQIASFLAMTEIKMKKILQFICIGTAMLFVDASAFAQNQTETTSVPTETKTKIDFTLEGMIAVSFGDGIVGINVGGPSLKLKMKNFKIGVGAFPSLIIMDGKATPRLAVSPILEYKKWLLIAPYYGYDSKDNMLWTFGIGYKFK